MWRKQIWFVLVRPVGVNGRLLGKLGRDTASLGIDACSADIEPVSFYVAFLTTLRPFARRTMRHNNYLRGDQCRILHLAWYSLRS